MDGSANHLRRMVPALPRSLRRDRAADDQNFMARADLDELARQLKIDDALKARLEQQVKGAGDNG